MYMHPYIGILRTYRRSDGLYTIPDGPNTITCQSDGTNDVPRDPLHGPITGGSVLKIYLYGMVNKTVFGW